MTQGTNKKPKAFFVECKGGPHKQLRVEGGLEPPELVPFPGHGKYVLEPGPVYIWHGKLEV